MAIPRFWTYPNVSRLADEAGGFVLHEARKHEYHAQTPESLS
jgi:hypothetical protein